MRRQNSYTDYFNIFLFDSNGNILAAQETGKDISFSAGVDAAGSYFVVVTLIIIIMTVESMVSRQVPRLSLGIQKLRITVPQSRRMC